MKFFKIVKKKQWKMERFKVLRSKWKMERFKVLRLDHNNRFSI